jgi:peptidoglycan hydrolase-like protein with peptidoglycan-binding domain
VQWCLWRFGLLDQSGIDGTIGSKSEAALKTAQKRLGLSVDGIAGKNTREKFKIALEGAVI